MRGLFDPCWLFSVDNNIDTSGRTGVRFSRAYVTCPVCVPARRFFMMDRGIRPRRYFIERIKNTSTRIIING